MATEREPMSAPWDWSVPDSKPYPATESGRLARGQLEDAVDRACKFWLVHCLSDESACTVRWITEFVSGQVGREIRPTGVHAVLVRWQEIDYAMIEGDPLEFVGFTAAGMEFGLEELYRRAERDRRVSHSEDGDA